ncbi:glycosyltransferase family 4 protein [Spirulina subsalsa]|nr:glycosyltransferase family 4 protein [Spirulina subsalsa]
MRRLSSTVISLVGDGSYFPVREVDGVVLYKRDIGAWLTRRIMGLSIQQGEEKALSQFLVQRQIDVVLAEYGPTACAVLKSCQMAGIPLVAHFHGFDAFQYSTAEEYKDRYQTLFKKAACLIAASQSMASQLCLLGALPEQIAVNHYGVDVSKFQGGQPSKSPPNFVAVGRFIEKKAPHLTLLAFHKVVEQVPTAHLTMIGDGPLLEACKQLVVALNLKDQVTLRGVCPPEEVVNVLRQARAFVQHSLRTSGGDSESLGVVFLEAGAMGLPSVATKHDGIPEVILDGKTGLLAEEGNIEQFAEHMIALAQDPELAENLGNEAYKRVNSQFTEERSLSNLYKILTEITQK